MWGITGRSARTGEARRAGHVLHSGITRIAVRGPLEHAVLNISGELDFSGSTHAIVAAMKVPHRIVAIDLAGLEFVDVEGALAIERIRDEHAARHGERPRMLGVSPAVARTMRIVGSHVDHVRDAVAATRS